MYYLFYISFTLILAVWVIYPFILKAIISVNKPNISYKENADNTPNVSVVIAAHNEGKNLVKRCENIFLQEYVGDIEVVIASDGSNDSTESVVRSLNEQYSSVKLLVIQPQSGRSNAHNLAIKMANNDILIFTDAETVFDKKFIANIVRPFSNQNVGFVSGKLKYFNSNKHTVSESVSLYWKFEMFLRRAESNLGLYATGTGACCAVRKSIYRTIPNTDDVDFITPLDTVLQGFKCIHSDNAIAWDELPDSPKKELNARIRMTSKNIRGTLWRWGIVSIFKHPLYSISLFLHKIGRWLTPFYLIGLFASSLFFLKTNSLFFSIILLLQVLVYFLGILGFLKIKILYSEQIYGFLLANVGFLLGVLNVLFGNVPQLYKPVGQQ